ncbi:MAG: PA2169 family four-helix-bundle protein [Acidimicrobiales bacterium]
MSTDEKVARDLVQTLEDGKNGFESAAAKLTDSDAPDLATTFMQFSRQRDEFANELREIASTYGDDADASGSIAGAVHRGWMSVKDALAGSDPEGVLDAAEQGEDHAVSEYQKALDADISAGLRTVLERQFIDVRAAHDTVRAQRDAFRSN